KAELGRAERRPEVEAQGLAVRLERARLKMSAGQRQPVLAVGGQGDVRIHGRLDRLAGLAETPLQDRLRLASRRTRHPPSHSRRVAVVHDPFAPTLPYTGHTWRSPDQLSSELFVARPPVTHDPPLEPPLCLLEVAARAGVPVRICPRLPSTAMPSSPPVSWPASQAASADARTRTYLPRRTVGSFP